MANVEKLEELMDHLRMHPEEHDQDCWAYIYDEEEHSLTGCGTTLCAAGHRVVLSGCQILWQTDSSFAYRCRTPDGLVTTIQEAARTILELTHAQAHIMFHIAQTLDDVEQAVKDIINKQQAA